MRLVDTETIIAKELGISSGFILGARNSKELGELQDLVRTNIKTVKFILEQDKDKRLELTKPINLVRKQK